MSTSDVIVNLTGPILFSDYEEDYTVAGVEDRQSLAIRSDDESIQGTVCT